MMARKEWMLISPAGAFSCVIPRDVEPEDADEIAEKISALIRDCDCSLYFGDPGYAPGQPESLEYFLQ